MASTSPPSPSRMTPSEIRKMFESGGPASGTRNKATIKGAEKNSVRKKADGIEASEGAREVGVTPTKPSSKPQKPKRRTPPPVPPKTPAKAGGSGAKVVRPLPKIPSPGLDLGDLFKTPPKEERESVGAAEAGVADRPVLPAASVQSDGSSVQSDSSGSTELFVDLDVKQLSTAQDRRLTMLDEEVVQSGSSTPSSAKGPNKRKSTEGSKEEREVSPPKRAKQLTKAIKLSTINPQKYSAMTSIRGNNKETIIKLLQQNLANMIKDAMGLDPSVKLKDSLKSAKLNKSFDATVKKFSNKPSINYTDMIPDAIKLAKALARWKIANESSGIEVLSRPLPARTPSKYYTLRTPEKTIHRRFEGDQEYLKDLSTAFRTEMVCAKLIDDGFRDLSVPGQVFFLQRLESLETRSSTKQSDIDRVINRLKEVEAEPKV